MTSQIPDSVRYEGVEYEIVGIAGDGLFHPFDHGLAPVPLHTACWRGFICTYEVADCALLLRHLVVGVDRTQDRRPIGEVTPPIDGVVADFDDREHVVHYKGMHLPVPFTGGLLLGEGFISDLYVHMGFHPAWKYERVVELVVEDGAVVSASDRSAAMAKLRAEITAGDRPDPDAGRDLPEWIARTFTLDYGRSIG